MFVRVLFFVLLALNLGAACWLFFTSRTAIEELPATDPHVPKLVLLSETEHDAIANGTPAPNVANSPKPADATNSATPSNPARDVCMSIGAFTTQADLRRAVNALTPAVARIQFREMHVSQVRGYWVYLPAPAYRERALAIARELAGRGVSDYYVVTAGDQPNAISLGLFHDPTNAEKRRSEIVALGFKPEMIRRSDDVPVYWVDYAQNSDQPFDWRARVPRNADLHAQPIECF